jgi:hypothetical protein
MRRIIALALCLAACRDEPPPSGVEPRPQWPPEPVEYGAENILSMDFSTDARVIAWFDGVGQSQRDTLLQVLDLWTGDQAALPDVLAEPLVWSLDSSLLTYSRPLGGDLALFALREGEELAVGSKSSLAQPQRVAHDGSAVVFGDLAGQGVRWRPDGTREELGDGGIATQVDPRSGLMGWHTAADTTLLLPSDGPTRELPGRAVVSATGRAAWHDYETFHVEGAGTQAEIEADFDLNVRDLVWSEGGDTLAIQTGTIGDELHRGLMFLPPGADEAQRIEGVDIPEWSVFSRGERFVFLDEGTSVLQTWSQGEVTVLGTGACAYDLAMSSFVVAYVGGDCDAAAPDSGWMFDLLSGQVVGPLSTDRLPLPHGDGVLHRDPATGELWLTRRAGSERVAQGVTEFASNGVALAYTQPGQTDGLVRIEAEVEGELPELPASAKLVMTEHHLLVLLEDQLWVALLSPSS